jgi:hypothetical protein
VTRECSIISCTSSSRSTCTTPLTAAAACLPTTSPCSGWASQPAIFREMPAERSLPRMTVGERKLFCTKFPRLRPMRSLRLGTMAVWGILIPMG